MPDQVRAMMPSQSWRFAARSAVGWGAVAACGTGFLLLLLTVRVRWPAVVRLDESVADALNGMEAGNGLLTKVMAGLTDFGGKDFLARVLLFACAYLLIRGQPRLMVYVAVTALGALILDPTLTLLLGRLSFVVNDPVVVAEGMSHPSGHALGSVVSYGMLMMVFLPVVPRRWRPWAATIVALLVVGAGFTRLALGGHYLSDMAAGWLLGVVWLATTAYAFRQWRREEGTRRNELAHGLEPEAASALRGAPPSATGLTHPRRATATLAAAWVMILGLVYGAGLLVTAVLDDTWLVAADRTVVGWLVAHRRPALTEVAHVGSQIANSHWILAVTVAAAVLTLALRRRWRPVLFLAVAIIGEVTLFLISSSIINRDRPQVAPLGPEIPPTSSFPSGHAGAAICLYAAIAILVWHWYRDWRRWAAVAGAIVVPGYVALARLYYGVHHPLDIVGSLLMALPWLAACWWALLSQRSWIKPTTNIHHPQPHAPTLIGHHLSGRQAPGADRKCGPTHCPGYRLVKFKPSIVTAAGTTVVPAIGVMAGCPSAFRWATMLMLAPPGTAASFASRSRPRSTGRPR